MANFNLTVADSIAGDVLAEGRRRDFLPLTVAIVDGGGHLLVLKREDGASSLRPQIALAKAGGCIALGLGGREQAARVGKMPAFFAAISHLAPHGLLPVPGGVLVRDANNTIVGAVGVTGDTSDNDEACALAAIGNAGLVADTGV